DSGGQIELFPDGDIAWSGGFTGSGDGPFADATAGTNPAFIARLSADGEPRWITSFSRIGPLAVDREHDRVIFAYSNRVSVVDPPPTVEFGIGALTGDGDVLWRLPFSGDGNATPRDIEMLPD